MSKIPREIWMAPKDGEYHDSGMWVEQKEEDFTEPYIHTPTLIEELEGMKGKIRAEHSHIKCEDYFIISDAAIDAVIKRLKGGE